MTITYKATEEVQRTARRPPVPLGLVWVKSAQRVLSLDLEKALGKETRVHKGLEGLTAEPPAAVICCPDNLDGDEEELAQEIEGIRTQAPGAPIIVLAFAPNLQLARGALKAGASGLIHVGMRPEQILRALSVALRGEVVLPRGLLHQWVEEHCWLAPRIDLSPRQRGILELVVEGLTNAEIARCLSLNESTIKQHLHATYKLLGVKNRREAAALWRKFSWRYA